MRVRSQEMQKQVTAPNFGMAISFVSETFSYVSFLCMKHLLRVEVESQKEMPHKDKENVRAIETRRECGDGDACGSDVSIQ